MSRPAPRFTERSYLVTEWDEPAPDGDLPEEQPMFTPAQSRAWSIALWGVTAGLFWAAIVGSLAR